jgi:peptide chain release factor 2
MKNIIHQLEDLLRRVDETWKLLDLDKSKVEVDQLQAQSADPAFWSDADKAKRIGQRLAELQKELAIWEGIRKEIADNLDVAKALQEEGDETMHDELAAKVATLEKQFADLEFYILFDGAYDKNNAIVTFHSGSGGTEAQDWAEMLLRMITRYAEKKGWSVNVLHLARGQEAGIKGATLQIEGRYAYGYLKSEHGVHRLVRISPFDAEQMRHTSFALIEVMPELDESVEVKIDPKDLRIDTYMSGGKGGQGVNTTYSAVRIVHIPTNITVTCQNERSQKQNKESAMKVLASRLHQLEMERQADKKKELRGDYQSAEWGNQIRSYVLHPYKMVNDHRSELKTTNPEEVLEGNLEQQIEAYLRYRKTNKS